MKLFIECSKTDQFREGAWVVIGATGKPTCPVNCLDAWTLLRSKTGSRLSRRDRDAAKTLESLVRTKVWDPKSSNSRYGFCTSMTNVQ